MIRVAVCDQDAAERIRLRDALERYTGQLGINNVMVIQFVAAGALERAIARMREDFFDLCFCRIDGEPDGEGEAAAGIDSRADAGEGTAAGSQGVSAGLAVAQRLRQEHPDLRMILTSKEKADALCAYDLDADFLLISGSYDDFERVVSGFFADFSRSRSALAAVKSGNGVENVVLDDIQFVESSKRGPIIHLPSGKTVPVRGTLQTLYENLTEARVEKQGEQDGADPAPPAPDRRFVKAGSSFIVNLDNVRSAGEGSLIFADGEAIIVPVRKRKAVLDALHSYCLR